MAADTPPSRNAPCPCGSGKRYKHCHGSEAPVAVPVPTREAALDAHRAGMLGRAEILYRRALDENPADVDCLHMLGVVQMERMRYREALDLLWDAAERTGWATPQIRHNLGLVLGKLMTREANVRQADLLEAFVAAEQARVRAKVDVAPLVTVVLPAYNHAEFVAESIASVAAQTYANIELVVIDDGSTDATAAVIEQSIADLRFPVHFVSRENRGAPATLNEGAALARGRYIAFLNSDDHYAPDRIASLVEEIAGAGIAWGFSLVANANGPGSGDKVDILQRQRNFLGMQPHSFTLVEYNVAVSTGNLFVARDFFLALGGFRNYRYNHDWDFCLRSAALVEPVIVGRPLYFYRFHPRNTIAAAQEQLTEDADRVFRDFLASALAGTARPDNALGPYAPENRGLLLKFAFRAGQGALVPVPVLQALAREWRAREDSQPPTDAAGGARRAAVVVLGMHRSGTSAMSRVLNLCGAYLPDKVKPPKLGVNPKGFWEPEAVTDLNVRLMRQLGGDWCHVDYVLPDAGEVIDEFASDAAALLDEEYGDAPTILIKDPRICVLAPLWHRTLLAAGFRPVYVVPVRNPLEVAQSLHARGDMSVADGLKLWAVYMEAVLAFVQGRHDVIFVRYVDLLDDWRDVVGRIAARLNVPLDAGARADEVDRFLERDLRQQTANDAALAALTASASTDAMREVYRLSIARCMEDATRVAKVPATVSDLPATSSRPGVPEATVGFALCIEDNAIRDQALLLCESIRRFGGRYREAPIMAFAPRQGLGVDAATRRRLETLGVEYVDVPLNTSWHDYPPANRVVAGAYAEAHADTDFVVVLDSDTVWLEEPELPLDADAAVRVVDSKGSATRGPGDRFEAYWERMAAMGGITLDRLPMVRSTIGNERIRACYNGGLAVVRRNKGILTRCKDMFVASLAAGMKPYRGTGMNVYASTGAVGETGSEYWGSDQTALALAIWAATDRVVHYPDHYNVPLHLVAADGDIDPRWLARPPAHLHYHYMFAARYHEVAMEILAKMRLAADRRDWLLERTPLAEHKEQSPGGKIAAA